MKYIIGISAFLLMIVITACTNQRSEQDDTIDTTTTEAWANEQDQDEELVVHPVNHATFVIEWKGLTIYNDPNGGAEAFESYNAPDIILISDIHGDHLNQEALDSLDTRNATFIMPQAVADRLPESYRNSARILNNGDEVEVKGIKIKAMPMYNLPETKDSRHPKGRGNGYVLTLGEKRVYISGDTEDIEEMRTLEDIDIAFVTMNLPYTMSVEQAADGVIAFAPKVVYPYHYRGQDGLSDVNKFKELVENAAGKDIEVRLEDWYGDK